MASRITNDHDRLKRFAEPAAYTPRTAGLYSEVTWSRPQPYPPAQPHTADDRPDRTGL